MQHHTSTVERGMVSRSGSLRRPRRRGTHCHRHRNFASPRSSPCNPSRSHVAVQYSPGSVRPCTTGQPRNGCRTFRSSSRRLSGQCRPGRTSYEAPHMLRRRSDPSCRFVLQHKQGRKRHSFAGLFAGLRNHGRRGLGLRDRCCCRSQAGRVHPRHIEIRSDRSLLDRDENLYIHHCTRAEELGTFRPCRSRADKADRRRKRCRKRHNWRGL